MSFGHQGGYPFKATLSLFQIVAFGDKIVMVLELAGHGDLLEYIKLRGALDERRSRRLLSQIVAAIEYLHARNLVHRQTRYGARGRTGQYPTVCT